VPAERAGAATLLLTAAGYGGPMEVAWLVEPSQVVGGPRGGDRREEVEVGEDGKDEAPAAARRTLAARHGASRSERMVRMGRGQPHDEP